jgi:hypothetical protein
MDFLSKPIPAFLYRKSNQIIMVVFAAIFALVFLNVYNPFGIEPWSNEILGDKLQISDNPSSNLFVFTSVLVLVGILITAISRTIMYFVLRKRTIAVWSYIVWVLCEVLLMSLLLAGISIAFKEQPDAGIIITSSLKNTSLLLLLPYSFCVVLFALQEKNMQIKRLAGATNERLAAQGLIPFYDERGELRLSVRYDHLLLLESADNYVCVWYLSNGEPQKVMIRTSLKRLSGQFDGMGIVRCHRSYMVNIDQVKIVRREKDGATLDLGIEGVPKIPISQTYNEEVTKWLLR